MQILMIINKIKYICTRIYHLFASYIKFLHFSILKMNYSSFGVYYISVKSNFSAKNN